MCIVETEASERSRVCCLSPFITPLISRSGLPSSLNLFLSKGHFIGITLIWKGKLDLSLLETRNKRSLFSGIPAVVLVNDNLLPLVFPYYLFPMYFLTLSTVSYNFLKIFSEQLFTIIDYMGSWQIGNGFTPEALSIPWVWWSGNVYILEVMMF